MEVRKGTSGNHGYKISNVYFMAVWVMAVFFKIS
jgi:hypothetical protein